MSDTKPTDAKPTGLALLREKFPPHQISKLPKPTKQQTEAVRADVKAGIRCGICGAWHHKNVVHLDYVGHAALTDRLLDADPNWTWEPAAIDANGLPILDKDGGLWIKLTVCGVTRLGYGDAQGKTGGDAMKERIGDALRNAAMRFGAALDLWHKGDLHVEEEPEAAPAPAPVGMTESVLADYLATIDSASTVATLKAAYTKAKTAAESLNDRDAYKTLTAATNARKAALEAAAQPAYAEQA